MFHLFTHAFFKALLFLGAGSVIHAMHHEQDMRNMGGLWNKIPFTFAMMTIGTLALTGFGSRTRNRPRRLLLQGRHHRGGLAASEHSSPAMIGFVSTVVAAGLTSFYSWRLVFMTFFGQAMIIPSRKATPRTNRRLWNSPKATAMPMPMPMRMPTPIIMTTTRMTTMATAITRRMNCRSSC